MKITKKKILGLLGLFGVAAVTTLAVLLPQTGVSATSSTTDKISVTVERGTPLLEITSPKDGYRLPNSMLKIALRHEQLSGGRIIIERLSGGDGNPITDTINIASPYAAGTAGFEYDLKQYFPEGFGYGEYKITALGDAYGVSPAVTNAVTFIYNALNPGGTGGTTPGGTDPGDKKPGFETDENGDPIVDPGVDPENPHVDHTHVTIYPTTGDGEEPGENVPPFLEGDVQNGDKWTVPFSQNCPQTGWYYFKLEAVDDEGNQVGMTEEVWFYWNAETYCALPTANLGSPNTGGLFNGANISRQDALITGLVVFLAAAALGTYLIVRRKKATAKRNKR